MDRTMTISEELYRQLEKTMRQRGLGTVEQLLREWQTWETELEQRRNAVHKIDELRDRLFRSYGEMPDSVTLIREDRAR